MKRLIIVVDGVVCAEPERVAREVRDASDATVWLRRCSVEAVEAIVAEVGAEGIVVGRDVALAKRLGIGVQLQATAPTRPDVGLVGVSCHDGGELAGARRLGADYVTLSPVWKTTSAKPVERGALGLRRFSELASRVDLPVYALGGVTAERVGSCLDAGAAGVAVLGAVCQAEDVSEAVRELERGLR